MTWVNSLVQYSNVHLHLDVLFVFGPRQWARPPLPSLPAIGEDTGRSFPILPTPESRIDTVALDDSKGPANFRILRQIVLITPPTPDYSNTMALIGRDATVALNPTLARFTTFGTVLYLIW